MVRKMKAIGDEDRLVWLDGNIVPWDQARLHVNTHCVLGGLNAYEVVAAHWSDQREELFLFRLDEHLRRLSRSCKVMRMNCPFSSEELQNAMTEIIVSSALKQDTLIRIVVYIGEGPFFSIKPEEIGVGAFILPFAANPIGKIGLHCGTTTWFRASDNSVPPRVKVGANYQNVRLAYIQARINGYDVPILLNGDGKVAESHLSNIFVVRDGVALTPSPATGILEGITRLSLLDIIPEELRLPVQEREIDKTELYMADEIFLAGTAKDEVVPVLSVDGYQVGKGSPGIVTTKLIEEFQRIVVGNNQRYASWLTPVYHRG